MLELRRLVPDAQYSTPTTARPPRLGPPPAGRTRRTISPTISRPAERLLDALRPALLVFAKLDLWPELATRAARAGPGGHGRRHGEPRQRAASLAGEAVLRAGYRAVAAAAAVSDGCRRLARLGVASERIQVLGDPRFDSVLRRVGEVAPDDPLLRLGDGAPTLVAGSTWPADEAVLLGPSPGCAPGPDARLILVPHEPTAGHLAAAETARAGRGCPHPVRLSAATGPAPLMLVDRVGVLAALYGAGTMAYVGGGFGSAGLHSVLEPAAWGLPVAFGPRWGESRDAGLLLEAGAAEASRTLRGGGLARGGWDGSRTSRSGRRRASGRRRWCRRAGERPGARPGCWRRLFRHDPFERHRPRNEEPQCERADQHVAPAASHLDPQSATPLPPTS